MIVPFRLSVFAPLALTALATVAACTETTIITAAEGKPTPDAALAVVEPPPPVESELDAGDPPDGMMAPDTSVPVDPMYPAKHTPIPLVDWNGGEVLGAPKIVTITFAGDTQAAQLEEFGDTITATPWWDAITAEYCSPPDGTQCIKRGSGGGHVVIPTAPATSFTDSAQGGASSIQTFIKAKVAAGTFPAPTADTIYAIYFPSSVGITLDGASSCQEFGAYHNSVSLTAPFGGATFEVAYAIMPRCDSSLTTTTTAASHEFVEAATDPHVGTANGVAYYMMDQLWGMVGGEVGDVCVDFQGNDTIVQNGFTVQRSWSNKAAKASHDPCVPAPKGQAYFNTAPKANAIQTELAVGESTVIDLDGFSDGPMADWDVDAVDYGEFRGGTTNLSFTFDKKKANNGSKVKVTVKLESKPSKGYAIYGIVSRSGKATHLWPALIVAK